MADQDITLEGVRKMAADIGMTRLNEAQQQELLRATKAAYARRASLRTDSLTYADEPAHVYTLTQGETR